MPRLTLKNILNRKARLLETAKAGDKLDTRFGVVKILKRSNGKIKVLIDDDITATFTEIDFFTDFIV